MAESDIDHEDDDSRFSVAAFKNGRPVQPATTWAAAVLLIVVAAIIAACCVGVVYVIRTA